MSNVFSSVSTSVDTPVVSEQQEPNLRGAESLEEPLSDTADELLGLFDIQDNLNNLDSESRENLNEIDAHLKQVMRKRGLTPTKSNLSKVLSEVKEEMGLDADVDPDLAINRIGNVLKSYRDIAFIKDPAERRSLFMKLARMQSTKDMNKLIHETMTKYEVWQ